MSRIPVAVIGATGYTGAELVRLLLAHPDVELVELVGHSKAGKPVESVLPALAGMVPSGIEGGLVGTFDEERIARRAQVAFLCLPHGKSAESAVRLRARGLVVLDLSADFRLHDLEEHARWYGPHHAPALAPEAVYGLPELHRDALKHADLVAVPGCFPTATILPLAPLAKAGLLEPGPIVVDAKSGVSGAGREPGERTHFPETAEGFRAYKTGGTHRHTAEMEQELSALAGASIAVSFTPHLVPMNRGILSSSYVRTKPGVDAARATAEAQALYAGSPSVAVLPPGSCPDTLWVRGSNRAHLSYTLDPRTGWMLCQGAIDNLVKGASGQALQCFNVRMGLPEGRGISLPAAWP
jgi:N-acetyl-gamma-glutamyl-phosphate reductase